MRILVYIPSEKIINLMHKSRVRISQPRSLREGGGVRMFAQELREVKPKLAKGLENL